jgi:DNA ligase D-like protein (predicted 3'-phosphoesterase)
MLFVIQKHNASHLHHDLRLEDNGVLRSWAVPKGAPLRAGEKRLAVEVADHPMSWAKFQGTIPKGEYGAGKVSIWDKGNYEMIEDTGNIIKFNLHGKKAKGSYRLIRYKGGNQWLLYKVKRGSAKNEGQDSK